MDVSVSASAVFFARTKNGVSVADASVDAAGHFIGFLKRNCLSIRNLLGQTWKKC